MNQIIAGTGHRMDKLGGYSVAAEHKVLAVARLAIAELQLQKVISGMALGWDQAIALAAAESNIPLIAAIPFRGQERMWPQNSQDVYNDILSCAEEIVYVDEIQGYGLAGSPAGSYHAAKMNIRNRWMVRHSEVIAALWDGSSGGTRNCVELARQYRVSLRNFWPEFKALK